MSVYISLSNLIVYTYTCVYVYIYIYIYTCIAKQGPWPHQGPVPGSARAPALGRELM